MNADHFQCAKCQTSRTVESIGKVITGPVCPICKQPMKRIVIEQVSLGLEKLDQKMK